jgi:hypothetical protein
VKRENARFVIASEAKQSPNRPDIYEIATALRASQWQRKTFSGAVIFKLHLKNPED